MRPGMTTGKTSPIQLRLSPYRFNLAWNSERQ
jgi:hypothetical protein